VFLSWNRRSRQISQFTIPSFDNIKSTELTERFVKQTEKQIFNTTSTRSLFHYEIILKTEATAQMPTLVPIHNGTSWQFQEYFSEYLLTCYYVLLCCYVWSALYRQIMTIWPKWPWLRWLPWYQLPCSNTGWNFSQLRSNISAVQHGSCEVDKR
jgi:hypothetical protein